MVHLYYSQNEYATAIVSTKKIITLHERGLFWSIYADLLGLLQLLLQMILVSPHLLINEHSHWWATCFSHIKLFINTLLIAAWWCWIVITSSLTCIISQVIFIIIGHLIYTVKCRMSYHHLRHHWQDLRTETSVQESFIC